MISVLFAPIIGSKWALLCSILEYSWEGDRMIEWLSNLSWISSLSLISCDSLGKLLSISKSQFSHLQNGAIIEGVLAQCLQQSTGAINAIIGNCFLPQHVMVFSLPLKWAASTKTAVTLSYLKNRYCSLGNPNVSPIIVRQRIHLYCWHGSGHWDSIQNLMGPFRLLRVTLTSQLRVVEKYPWNWCLFVLRKWASLGWVG